MVKKSISRKMLLPVFLASFCSGANAMENKNVAPAQNMFQGGGVKSNLLGNTKNDSNKGFSGLAMAGTNALSLIGGGIGGYIAGSAMNAPKGTPHGPTQKQFDDLKAEKEKLEEENKKLKNSNPDAAKIQELEDKNKELTDENKDLKSDLNAMKPYLQDMNFIFNKFGIPQNQRQKALNVLLQESLNFMGRDKESSPYKIVLKQIQATLDAISKAGELYRDSLPYLLASDKNPNNVAWATICGNKFDNFATETSSRKYEGAPGMAHMLGKLLRLQSQLIQMLDASFDS